MRVSLFQTALGGGGVFCRPDVEVGGAVDARRAFRIPVAHVDSRLVPRVGGGWLVLPLAGASR